MFYVAPLFLIALLALDRARRAAAAPRDASSPRPSPPRCRSSCRSTGFIGARAPSRTRSRCCRGGASQEHGSRSSEVRSRRRSPAASSPARCSCSCRAATRSCCRCSCSSTSRSSQQPDRAPSTGFTRSRGALFGGITRRAPRLDRPRRRPRRRDVAVVWTGDDDVHASGRTSSSTAASAASTHGRAGPGRARRDAASRRPRTATARTRRRARSSARYVLDRRLARPRGTVVGRDDAKRRCILYRLDGPLRADRASTGSTRRTRGRASTSPTRASAAAAARSPSACRATRRSSPSRRRVVARIGDRRRGARAVDPDQSQRSTSRCGRHGDTCTVALRRLADGGARRHGRPEPRPAAARHPLHRFATAP